VNLLDRSKTGDTERILCGNGSSAKLQWLQNPSQINRNNMNNVRRETNRIFGNEKRKRIENINEL
jgi:hypothetical protein